jgi:hypothetical protein
VALKFQIPRKALFVRFILNPWGKAFVLAFALTVTAALSIFTFYYVKYARITEEKLRAGPFGNTSLLYAAPRPVMLGEDAQVAEMAAYLRNCGYSESSTNRLGWFRVRPDAIEINPGRTRTIRKARWSRSNAVKWRRSSPCAIRPIARRIFSNPS